MKQSIWALCVMFIGFLTSCGHVKATNSCPISSKTTKIVYSHHTNSGIAIYTTITLCEDRLIWEYDEARNNCFLKDCCKYSKEEFKELVNRLSVIQFSATDVQNYNVGGGGYSFSFESNRNKYFYYNNFYSFLGSYTQASSLILQFIEAHKTECERIFEKLSRMPHERGSFGEFRTLPKELKKYKVKR